MRSGSGKDRKAVKEAGELLIISVTRRHFHESPGGCLIKMDKKERLKGTVSFKILDKGE